jgi:hypothetical protein
MQHIDSVAGFSDLKDLLIRTHKIEKGRELIKLYFTESDDRLYMHDYNDHKKMITLCKSIREKELSNSLSRRSERLIREALNHRSPSQYLIMNFNLYGFFKM